MKFSKGLKAVIIGVISFILIVIVFNMFTFTVDEVNQAVITRFGEATKVIVGKKTEKLVNEIRSIEKFKNVEIIEGKGLHFKTPFVDNVRLYQSRLITYDTDPREVTTVDKKKLLLDNNAQWKITNPLLFLISMENTRAANTRLDDIMYSKLNEKIGKTEAHVLIADKATVNKILEDVVAEINNDVKSYGLEVVDIRIRKTDLPEENSQNIFNRMKTEREQKAKEYRSEGQEEAQKIKSGADKEAKIIEAQAYAEAEKIRGEGDAEATRIYNEAYSKDPEFYEFYRTLQAYKVTLKDNTKIVIDPSSPFAKYLFGNR